MKQLGKRMIAGLFTLFVLLGGCRDKQEESSSSHPSISAPSDGGYQPQPPDVLDELLAAKKKNSDVVGWLYIPNTTVDEAVVQTTNNEYYLRRDVEKRSDYAGCYYMDYESVMFDDGADLAQNSIIYGHNLGSPMGVKDDPNGVKFAQLLKLEDEQVAKDTPYIFFTTEAAVHVFEIFAAAYTEALTSPVPYHYAQYQPGQLAELAEDMKRRSTYTYDVEVTDSDKILTLSTCTYKYGTYSQNDQQRYVVMARLVQPGENYHETAVIEKNQNIKEPSF